MHMRMRCFAFLLILISSVHANAGPRLTVEVRENCTAVTSMGAASISSILAAPILTGLFKSLGDALVTASGKNSVTYSVQGTTVTSFYSEGKAFKDRCIDGTSGEFMLSTLITYSPDYSAMRIQPRLLRYPKSLGDRQAKSMLAAVDFMDPSGKVFASAILPLGIAPGGTEQKQEALAYASTGWVPLPTIPDAVVAKLNAGGSFAAHGPVTIRMTVTETRDYNKLLALLGESIGGKSADLSQAVHARLFETDPTAAENAAVVSARGSYEVKRLRFEKAKQDYDEAPSAALRIAAEEARWSALEAAAKAGVLLDGDDILRKAVT